MTEMTQPNKKKTTTFKRLKPVTFEGSRVRSMT